MEEMTPAMRKLKHEAYIKKQKVNGVKIAQWNCPVCDKEQETIAPRNNQVSAKGYWDGATQCLDCGHVVWKQVYPDCKVKIFSLEGDEVIGISEVDRCIMRAEKELEELTGRAVKLVVVDDLIHDHRSIVKIICNALDFEPEDVFAPTRKAPYVELRQMICYILKQRYAKKITYLEIAELVGYKEHTNVIHSITKCENMMATGDVQFVYKYHRCMKAIMDVTLAKKEPA